MLSVEDKMGGSHVRTFKCKRFVECVSNSGLMDLGFTGPRFTLKCGLIQERIDRALCNLAWLLIFSETKVYHLLNRPILVDMTSSSTCQKNGLAFTFQGT